MPATRYGSETPLPSLSMYHYGGYLQGSDKKLLHPNGWIVKYKKFVSLSDLRIGGEKDNRSGTVLIFLKMKHLQESTNRVTEADILPHTGARFCRCSSVRR